ncbi:MAG: DUF502 domain-containing protein [Proteobacteria bacterium]|nr:DUF502 domain-containing protein [Pseudomonadota bacterium]
MAKIYSERRKAAKKRQDRRRFGILSKIRGYFFAGILVTMPLTVTLALAWWLVGAVDNHIVPLIPYGYNPDAYLKEVLGIGVGLPGLGVLILLVFITLIGALTAGFLGRIVVSFGEQILSRMPVIRTVYSAIKQIIETVFKDQSNAFRHAVLVEYPRRGVWTIGFLTGTTEGEVQNLILEDVVNVYIPTTPNPTSGFLLYVPREDIQMLHMSVEEAVKMVISIGLVVPPDRRSESERSMPVVSAGRYENIESLQQKRDREGLVNPTED